MEMAQIVFKNEMLGCATFLLRKYSQKVSQQEILYKIQKSSRYVSFNKKLQL